MYRGMRVGVVVPAYNEGALIGGMLAGVPDWVDRVLVVDDGSWDGTAEVVAKKAKEDGRIRLVRHGACEGVGAAILRGYRELAEEQCSVLAVMAGDDQMDPLDLAQLVDLVVEGADYAKGNRFAHRDVWRAMPPSRILGNLVLSKITAWISGYPDLRDAQCGYTALRTEWLPRILKADLPVGYGFPNAMLSVLGAWQARLVQVTVRPRYGEEVSGLTLSTVLSTYPGVLWRSWCNHREIRRCRNPMSRGVGAGSPHVTENCPTR